MSVIRVPKSDAKMVDAVILAMGMGELKLVKVSRDYIYVKEVNKE